MIDKYKHIPADITTIVGTLRTHINSYNGKITELTTAINEINSSSAWIDADVKSAFIQTSNSYITLFNQIKSALETYVNYLEGKSSDGENMENSFAKVM